VLEISSGSLMYRRRKRGLRREPCGNWTGVALLQDIISCGTLLYT